MTEVKAETTFEVWADCPECCETNEITHRAVEQDVFNTGELRADKCELEVTCRNPDCRALFLVTSITH